MTDVPRDEQGEGAAEADAFTRARADVLAREDRDTRGRFCAGNAAAIKAGTRSRQVVEAPALVAAVRERAEAMTVDLGVSSGLSTAKLALVRELARLQIVTESLGADVLARGVMTGKGRTRAAVSAYLAVLDRQVRLAALIGLDRQSKPVTFADAIQQEPVRG